MTPIVTARIAKGMLIALLVLLMQACGSDEESGSVIRVPPSVTFEEFVPTDQYPTGYYRT